MSFENITLTGGNITRELDTVLRRWTDGVKYVIANYQAPIEIREAAKFVGTDAELIDWVKRFKNKYGAIYVVSDDDILYDMIEAKPTLQFTRLLFLRGIEIYSI